MPICIYVGFMVIVYIFLILLFKFNIFPSFYKISIIVILNVFIVFQQVNVL